MKMMKHIFAVALLLAGIAGGNRVLAADVQNGQRPPLQTTEQLTAKLPAPWNRFFTVPHDSLTCPELILKYKFALLVNYSYYCDENGDTKTKLTEKDFVKAGFPAFLYTYLIEFYKLFNQEMIEWGGTAEQRIETFNRSMESSLKQKPELEKKLAELEKQQAEKK